MGVLPKALRDLAGIIRYVVQCRRGTARSALPSQLSEGGPQTDIHET